MYKYSARIVEFRAMMCGYNRGSGLNQAEMFSIIPISNLATLVGVSAEVLWALAYSFSFYFFPTFKCSGRMVFATLVKCGIIRIEWWCINKFIHFYCCHKRVWACTNMKLCRYLVSRWPVCSILMIDGFSMWCCIS